MCGIHRKYEYYCGTCIHLHKHLPRCTTFNYCLNIVYNRSSNESSKTKKKTDVVNDVSKFTKLPSFKFSRRGKQRPPQPKLKNKHCNLLIYTVPLNRVLIEPCYYNIQTIKYHNNAELIFLQHISRRCQPRL